MPLLATVAALLIGAVMLVLMDADPVAAYRALWEGAFGTKNTFADTLIKATPLLLVGIGICISFRGGVVNIGGEGQMIVGGLAATALALANPDTRAEIIVPACLVASFIAGAVWGGIAGVLKAYFNVNEILSMVMLNQIATYWMIYLMNNTLIDPDQLSAASRIPETDRLPRQSDLPHRPMARFAVRLAGLNGPDATRWGPTLLHIRIIIGVIFAVLVWIFLWRTTIGYRIRAVGKNPRASRYAGSASSVTWCYLWC